jgi:uncharacterized membrane protein YozB (DUF420 family)
MRIFAAPIMAIIFIGWVCYLIFKKDVKKHKNEIFAGFVFIAVWAVIYVASFFVN